MSRSDDSTVAFGGAAGLSVDEALLLEGACDAFEAKWRAGGPPDIWAAVLELPESVRPEALRELVQLDVFYRRQAGGTPTADDYAARFPDLDPVWLAGVVAAADSHSTVRTTAPAAREGEGIGTVVAGRYTLVELIGGGGMGSVYLARQREPVKRDVALKLIKGGLDSKTVLARFDAERQALALMDHPNIARVFDGGTTATGRPFFVMELIRGVPVTQYCDEHRLTVKARLELFVQVCQAVQHAHQKGIIHRDLKPSNVLIAEIDGRPVPKVIDFGVAKATEQRLTDLSLADTGALVGTPAYMSPEQADPACADIDTRTDVYALGVVLYELLAGSTPLDVRQFRRGAVLEMLRMVREVEPPRASTRLSTAEDLPNIAANRDIEPAKLARLLRGELDWVVMRALEKDRSRRYETANGFAADVQRYLAGEPVQAVQPTAGYRLRKFLRRNKGPVAAAAAVFLALAAGAGVSAWQAVLATAAREEARGAERAAKDERDRAETERAKAEAERVVAKAVNEFWLKDVLDQARPDQTADRDLTLRAALDRAAGRVQGRFDRQPLVEAAIRVTIGEAYGTLGHYAASVPHLERALELYRPNPGTGHPDTLNAMNSLAWTYRGTGQSALADALFEEAMASAHRSLGLDHPASRMAVSAVVHRAVDRKDYARAEQLLTESLAAATRASGAGGDTTVGHLGSGPPVEHAGGDPTIGYLRGRLAGLYGRLGRFAEAEPVLVRHLDERRRHLGNDNSETVYAIVSLAALYKQWERYPEAEALAAEALATRRRVLGTDHSDTWYSMRLLAELHLAQKRYPAAEALYAEEVGHRRRVQGPHHARTLDAMYHQALLYLTWERPTSAERLLTEVLDHGRAVWGAEGPPTLNVMRNLARAHEAQGQYSKAEPLRTQVLRAVQRKVGADHADTLTASALLSVNLTRQGRFAEAERHLREALAVRTKKEPDSWATFNARSMLGGALLGQKQYAEAEPLLLTGYEGMKQREKSIPPLGSTRIPEALDRLIALYTATGKPHEVKKWLAERARYPEVAPPPREKK